jgi:2',3'-cyclic-nucleotide 2'-phosphodiesterase (5'-nucleotidase family)
LNVDYGHVLSFYQQLKRHCVENNMDLYLVCNGDWIDGTGMCEFSLRAVMTDLSSQIHQHRYLAGLATNHDASHLINLLEKMPWDAINVGNHELYSAEVIRKMTEPSGFAEWWGSKYLTSNVLINEEPMGNYYHVLRGKFNVLAFGFLYDMMNYATGVGLTVREVEAAVQESWFVQALKKEEYDAILILAHMGFDDPLVGVILTKIREVAGDVPVQFVTGHTHIRNFTLVDEASASFEAGRYLDTIGFVSFPVKAHAAFIRDDVNASHSVGDYFRHRYIDANIETLQQTLGMDNIDTEDGVELSKFIERTRNELGLEEVVGCVPETYMLNKSLDEEGSLWRLFRDEIVPSQFTQDIVLFISQGMWRYDLIKGEQILDDVIGVSPFNETFVALEGVPSEVIVSLNNTLNADNSFFVAHPNLPQFILCPSSSFEENGASYTLAVNTFEVDFIRTELEKLYPDISKISPMTLNLTTTDAWIHYIGREHPCKGSHHYPGSNLFHPSFDAPEEEVDRFRLAFAIAAIAVVVLLGAWNIKQRGEIWRRLVDQREFVTAEALREYQDEAVEDSYDASAASDEEGDWII